MLHGAAIFQNNSIYHPHLCVLSTHGGNQSPFYLYLYLYMYVSYEREVLRLLTLTAIWIAVANCMIIFHFSVNMPCLHDIIYDE